MLLNVDNDVAITNCNYGGCYININNEVVIYNRNYGGYNIARC